MKKENTKSPSKAPRSEEDLRIDVHDDELMIKLGIHPPYLRNKDTSLYIKTPNEKRVLKKLRKIHKNKIRFCNAPTKYSRTEGKIIVYLQKNKIYNNTTYSTKGSLNKLNEVLTKYGDLVSKYVYNGRTYRITERPFWY